MSESHPDGPSSKSDAELSSTPRPIVRAALHDEVARRLRDMIFEGELKPGSRIAERFICEQLHISRTPLREALKVLASEGLVDLLPHRGAQVSKLSTVDVDHMFEVIGTLEALAGELACARITEADVAEIRCMHEQMAEHYRRHERAEYFRLNQRIHERIVAGSGNPVLISVYGSLSARVRRARYMANLAPARWAQAMQEHEAILDALLARDATRLHRLLKEHLSHKRDFVKAALAEPEA
jgi:DNA-binding GntR family transcriptional regulator